MTTFKEFLSEKIIKKWNSKPLEIDKAINILNKHCSNGLKAIANGGILYRGDAKINGNFEIIDPSVGIRTSRDTNNLYQLMMDSSSALDDYPSRSKSLICHTKFEGAEFYKNPRVIIPFDDVPIVVSSSDDFIHMLIKNPFCEGSFFLREFSIHLGLLLDIKSKKFVNATELDNYPDIIWALGKALILRNAELDEFKKIIGKDKPFTKASSLIMTPENLKIHLLKSGDELPKNVECWFSGKCLSISLDMFGRILFQMKLSGMPISKEIESQFSWQMQDAQKEHTE